MNSPTVLQPLRIEPLSSLLANQIAAGEVVERPASVVKELLENALDAGADELVLEVEEGGRKLIRLRDNGSGIHPDDLSLALRRHATSKIHSSEELARVATLGFRGEALASIASISRLSLTSRREGYSEGWSLIGEGGERIPAAHPVGTTVEVRDLFYNTPARRKFLRAERTEYNHLEEVVRRIALSRFDVAVRLTHNGRETLRLPSAHDDAGQMRRVARLFGSGFIGHALSVEFTAAGLRLWGWLLEPEAARPQNDLQYFFLNGRVIRDRLVSHALRQAHQELIAPGRHPAWLLYLELDPATVDVNVHPTKHEVRFREARLVHDFLLRAIGQALESQTLSPQPGMSGDEISPEAPVSRPSEVEVGQQGEPAERNEKVAQVLFPSPRPLPDRRVTPQRIAEQGALYAPPAARSGPRRVPVAQTLPGQLIGLLDERVIAWRGAEGLLLFDLQELVRRLAFLQLSSADLPTQPMLLPQVVTLTEQEMMAVLDLSGPLSEIGFEFEALGEVQLVVRRVPAGFRKATFEPLLKAFATMAVDGPDLDRLKHTLSLYAPLPVAPTHAELESLLQEWASAEPLGIGSLVPPLGRCVPAGTLPALLGLDDGVHG